MACVVENQTTMLCFSCLNVYNGNDPYLILISSIFNVSYIIITVGNFVLSFFFLIVYSFM